MIEIKLSAAQRLSAVIGISFSFFVAEITGEQSFEADRVTLLITE